MAAPSSYWERMSALQGGAATQCYESNEKAPGEVPDETVPYDFGSTQPYLSDPIQQSAAKISVEMPPPKSLPRKRVKSCPPIEAPSAKEEELEQTQRYPFAELQTQSSGQGVASRSSGQSRASASSRMCHNHSILDVPDCDSEFEHMAKPKRQKRPRAETKSPECSKPMKAAPRTPKKGKAAIECSSTEKRRSGQKEKRPSQGGQLPAADKILRYSGKPASSEYITQRCKSVSGRTVKHALELQVKDHQGKPRIYRAGDLRYDLSGGRLTVD